MGDYLQRYAMYDKYFKKQGAPAPSCAARHHGKDSSSLPVYESWYYAWGAPHDTPPGWAHGGSAPATTTPATRTMAAWALCPSVDALKPKVATRGAGL
ncbi:hypothetical protein GCM10018952_41630 [Streptosporangium vulgare]